MTIDEGISMMLKTAGESRACAEDTTSSGKINLIEFAEKYEQIAEWLSQFKELKRQEKEKEDGQ